MTNKIKLVISDLHLGKGRWLKNGRQNPLEEFSADNDLIEFLEYYNSGPYAQLGIELIINGDLFNFFFVDYKGVYTHIIPEYVAFEQLQRAIQGHRAVFTALKTFLQLPQRQITYIVGNHDMAMLYPSLQTHLESVLDTKIQWKNFHHTIDGVHIEHGHQFEALNRTDPKRLFLTHGLPHPILNVPWSTLFCTSFLPKVKRFRPSIDKVRPIRLYLRWALINDFWHTIGLIIASFFFMLKTKSWAKAYPYCNFNMGLNVMKHMSLFHDLDEDAFQILSRHNNIHTVIFGHTHVPRIRQWHNGKQYLNTGTWTEITSLEVGSLGRHEKYTYALIDYRHGPFPVVSLKEWKGIWKPEIDARLS